MGILHGVAGYFGRHRAWSVQILPGLGARSPTWSVVGHRCGMIVRVVVGPLGDLVQGFVEASGYLRLEGLPVVTHGPIELGLGPAWFETKSWKGIQIELLKESSLEVSGRETVDRDASKLGFSKGLECMSLLGIVFLVVVARILVARDHATGPTAGIVGAVMMGGVVLVGHGGQSRDMRFMNLDTWVSARRLDGRPERMRGRPTVEANCMAMGKGALFQQETGPLRTEGPTTCCYHVGIA